VTEQNKAAFTSAFAEATAWLAESIKLVDPADSALRELVRGIES
jgi:hypothetical protein